MTLHARITSALFVSTALFGGGTKALAADQDHLLQSVPADLRIVGGELSKTCSFPSAVQIKRGGRMHCTGTLVHPEIVTTAQHCLGRSLTATFGERGEHKSIPLTCKSFRGGGDMAYCKLSEPVNDVPIVPILMGCELEALQKGVDIALVGFGNSSNNAGDGGVKREVITPIHAPIGEGGVGDVEILLGHSKKGSCNGDSGGPAYIDLRTVDGFKDKPGAGWRSFGITSRKGPGGGNCASTTVYGVTAKIVEWIEKDSGIDVTPCFDADGTWSPGPDCGGFPDPQAGGSWPACDPGKLSPPSQTCGDNDAADDDDSSDDDTKDSDDDTQDSDDDTQDSDDDTQDSDDTQESDDSDDSNEGPKFPELPEGCSVSPSGGLAGLLAPLMLLGLRRRRN